MSVLTDRLRGILGPVRRDAAAPALAAQVGVPPPEVAAVLGGNWADSSTGRCLVVERRWRAGDSHGRSTIGDVAAAVRSAADATVLGAGDVRPPFIFFDLETTGLSGGAGTYAFLVGCGWCDDDGGFTTRQFVLTRFEDERPLLAAAASALSGGTLVSFNGKSFDAPLLESRYLYHRLPWHVAELPHLDVLHPSRRFWGPPARARSAGVIRGYRPARELDEESDRRCSLGTLEGRILGAGRVDDVSGFEIPGRFFQFMRSGDARPLEAVLEHNRLDLLSLAALTAHLLGMVRGGHERTADAREALALARAYDRAGMEERAIPAARHAVALARREASPDAIEADAWRFLALTFRRARVHDESARCWRELLRVRGCPDGLIREASQALAVHHEHRDHDLCEARAFALRSLAATTDDAPGASWNDRVRHRLARLDRKMEKTVGKVWEDGSACGHASPRTERSEGEHQR